MLNCRIQYSGPDWYLFRHKLHLIIYNMNYFNLQSLHDILWNVKYLAWNGFTTFFDYRFDIFN